MGTRWLEGGRSVLGIRLPSIKKGSFGHNQLLTASQRSVALLAQLIFTPIITRLYAPEAYGLTNAVISLAGLLFPVFTLMYERAMLLAREEEDIQGLRAVVNVLPALFSTILFVVLLIGGDGLLTAIGLPAMGRLALLVPVLVVLSAWARNSWMMVAVRMRYKAIFVYGSISAVGNKLVAVAHGVLLGGGAIGLLIAELFLHLSQWIFNAKLVLRDNPLQSLLRTGPAGMRAVMRKYISFPRYELPATGLAQLGARIPLWWLPSTYGIAVFGQFSLSMALLEAPLSLLSHSMSQTFYQKAALVYHAEGPRRLRSITFRTMGFVSAVSLLPMLLVAIFSETIFLFFFGPDWGLAGQITQALTIMYLARLMVEPVMSVLRVINDQRAYVWFNAVLLVLRVGAAVTAVLLGLPLISALLMYAVAEALGRMALAAWIIHRLNRLARDHRATGGSPAD